MANFNKVLLIGNLTRDPELRVTPKGTPVCQFSIAVNRQYKDDTGTQQSEVTFLDIESWGRQGEVIAKYMSKGRPIFVEGRLRLDQWEDRNTKEKRSRLKIVLENFQFLGGGGGEGGGGGDRGSSYRQSPAPAARDDAPESSAQGSSGKDADLDDDVPF